MERAHLTHTEEFCEVTDASFHVPELRNNLLQWEKVYNTIRHHQSLGYLTPQEFLECYFENKRKEVMCHKVLNEDKCLTKTAYGGYHWVTI